MRKFFGIGKKNNDDGHRKNTRDILGSISGWREEENLPQNTVPTSTNHYLFLALVDMSIEPGQSDQAIARQVADKINLNPSAVEFFASITPVNESEAYMLDPASVIIALPKDFKLRFAFVHDGNARYHAIDVIKPEHVFGYLKQGRIYPLNQSLTDVYFLNDRQYYSPFNHELHLLYAYQVYQLAISHDTSRSTWVGVAPFSMLAHYYPDLNHAALATYQLSSERRQAFMAQNDLPQALSNIVQDIMQSIQAQLPEVTLSPIQLPPSFTVPQIPNEHFYSQLANNFHNHDAFQSPPDNSDFWNPVEVTLSPQEKKAENSTKDYPLWMDNLPDHLKNYAIACWKDKLDEIDDAKFDEWHAQNDFIVKPTCFVMQLWPKIPVKMQGELYCLESLQKCDFKSPKDRSRFTWDDVQPDIIARDQLMGLKKRFPLPKQEIEEERQLKSSM